VYHVNYPKTGSLSEKHTILICRKKEWDRKNAKMFVKSNIHRNIAIYK
jgi:hypothetical protein